MSTWESAAEAWASSPGPHAAPPATWGEIAAANARQGALGTFFGAGEMQERAYRELETQLQTVTGQDAATFTEQWGGRGPGEPILFTDRAYLIGQKLGKLDKGQQEAIAPYLDITGRAAAAAQKASEEDAAVFARTYGVGGGAVAWATYLGRQMLDPLNLGTAIATGGAGAGATGIVSMLGREAVAGAAQAALAEPLIAREREKLGLPNVPYLEAVASGAVFNVAGAAVLKGAVHGVVGGLRGAAAVGRYLRTRGIEPPLHPDDALAVADAVETQNVMTEQAHPPTPKARAEMPPRIDRAAQALEGGRRIDDTPAAGGGADPTLAGARDLQRMAETGVEGGAPTAPPALGPHEMVLPDGGRLVATPKIMELADLTVSHSLDGRVNPNYPQELQGRDRSSAASRSWVAEKAAQLEPALLGLAPTAQEGAPIVGSDGVVEAGNGRAMLIARAYDRHPERADAYRAALAAQGFSTAGFKYPVLVRVRQGELSLADRAGLARKFNISATAHLSPSERAFSDATLLDDELLSQYRSGSPTSAANIPFVRAFAERVVAPGERSTFVTGNVLSVEGARRLEAALVAKAYDAPDVIAGLYEVRDPSSRAILGGLADNAAKAARVKAEIEAGRIEASLDPSPALIDAFRLVERARATGQKVEDLINQVDIELGAVSPHVVDAVDLYFRDPPKSAAAKEAGVAYRVAAGRQAIGPQINRSLDTALARQNAVADIFGFKADAGFALREGRTAEIPPEDLDLRAEEAAAAAETGAPAPAEETPAAEPALAGILPPEPVYPPPPPGTTPEAAALLEKARAPGPGSVSELLARGAGADELGAHPDIVAAHRYAESLTPTSKLPGFGSPRFWRERVYKFGERTVVGDEAAIDELVNVARAYSTRGPVRNERQAIIVIGPPAAGKSSLADPLAAELHAAIPDPDDAKKVIDGFSGGVGANAVHLESSLLGDAVKERLTQQGANLVIPKVGDDAAAIEKLIGELKQEGYSVDLVSVFVEPDEAYRRMIGRYLQSNRIINDTYFKGIGAKPSETYHIINGKGLVDEAVEVDRTSARHGEPGRFRDGADTGLGKRLHGEPGSGGSLGARPDGRRAGEAPEGAPGADRRVREAGGRRDLTADAAGYTEQALRNLRKTSRTAGGVIDTSSTAGKAEKMVAGLTGAEAAARAVGNFTGVIGDLYDMRATLPSDAAGVTALVDRTAARINEGIVKPGEIDRTLDTKIASQTRVADLPAAKEQFAEELAARLADPEADPVETAAWIEWRANVIDHFWSDGTGKTSRALAAVPLMRAGLPLPEYPVNKVIYSYAPAAPVDPAAGGPGYLGADWQRWNYFYHELIPERPAPVVAKPIGDPQLEADAQAVVDQVGPDFLIKIGDAGEEIRTVSIAEARAEAAEIDAAADELLACIAGAGGAAAAAGGAAAVGATP